MKNQTTTDSDRILHWIGGLDPERHASPLSPGQARPRAIRSLAVAAACSVLVLLATGAYVDLTSADLKLHANTTGGANGAPSYTVKLSGLVVGAAARSMSLGVKASSSADQYRLAYMKNDGTEVASVTHDGRIGVGTTAHPSATVHLNALASTDPLKISGDVTSSGGLSGWQYVVPCTINPSSSGR